MAEFDEVTIRNQSYCIIIWGRIIITLIRVDTDRNEVLMEITTVDEDYEDLLEYLNRTGYVTELYVMTGKNRIHATAVAPDVSELKYLARMVSKKFEDKIKTIVCHGVKEIVKDKFGGVEYDRAGRESNKRNE